jgi:hypothetical protein
MQSCGLLLKKEEDRCFSCQGITLSQRPANITLEGTGKSRAAFERHSLLLFYSFSYAFGHRSPALQLRVGVRHEVAQLADWQGSNLCLDQSQRSPAGTIGGMLAARCAVGMKPFRQCTESCESERGRNREVDSFLEASSG